MRIAWSAWCKSTTANWPIRSELAYLSASPPGNRRSWPATRSNTWLQMSSLNTPSTALWLKSPNKDHP